MKRVCRQMLVAVICLLPASIPAFATQEQPAAVQDAPAPAAAEAQKAPDGNSAPAEQNTALNSSPLKEQVAQGYLLIDQNSLEEAGRAFDNALAINPRYHDALTGKGIVLARMGKEDEAIKLLQQALVLNPNPVRTYYELGLLYEKRGDYAQAITEYKNGIDKYKQGRK